MAPALAAPGVSATTVFGDVPVMPGAIPDYARHSFALRGNPKVRPQTFSFGVTANSRSVAAWYRARLQQRGWHIDSERFNYPGPGSSALIASRPGEAVTVIMEAAPGGTRVSLIKLNAAK